jgi:hypothetical protein
MLVRALWSLDLSSSPSVLRIVDLIATMRQRGRRAEFRAEHRVHDTAARIAARMTGESPVG